MSATKSTSRGASALPRSRATLSFNSAASAIRPLPDQFASFFKMQKQTSASPLMESGMPIVAASLTCECATRIDSIGDARTDEEAFSALEKRGVAILVSEHPQVTAANYWLNNPEEVERFLGELIARL